MKVQMQYAWKQAVKVADIERWVPVPNTVVKEINQQITELQAQLAEAQRERDEYRDSTGCDADLVDGLQKQLAEAHEQLHRQEASLDRRNNLLDWLREDMSKQLAEAEADKESIRQTWAKVVEAQDKELAEVQAAQKDAIEGQQILGMMLKACEQALEKAQTQLAASQTQVGELRRALEVLASEPCDQIQYLHDYGKQAPRADYHTEAQSQQPEAWALSNDFEHDARDGYPGLFRLVDAVIACALATTPAQAGGGRARALQDIAIQAQTAAEWLLWASEESEVDQCLPWLKQGLQRHGHSLQNFLDVLEKGEASDQANL